MKKLNKTELEQLSISQLIQIIIDLQVKFLELQEENKLLKEELARAKKSRLSQR